MWSRREEGWLSWGRGWRAEPGGGVCKSQFVAWTASFAHRYCTQTCNSAALGLPMLRPARYLDLGWLQAKWGNMSWNGSPDIPESKQMASMSFWCRICHGCCQRKHPARPHWCQFLGPVGKCGDKICENRGSKTLMGSHCTVPHWTMRMLNAVPMVTELGKHSTANVTESAQMQT